jgi:hypothetical protein
MHFTLLHQQLEAHVAGQPKHSHGDLTGRVGVSLDQRLHSTLASNGTTVGNLYFKGALVMHAGLSASALAPEVPCPSAGLYGAKPLLHRRIRVHQCQKHRKCCEKDPTYGPW